MYHRVFSVTNEGMCALGRCHTHIARVQKTIMRKLQLHSSWQSSRHHLKLIWSYCNTVDITSTLFQWLHWELSFVKFAVYIIHRPTWEAQTQTAKLNRSFKSLPETILYEIVLMYWPFIYTLMISCGIIFKSFYITVHLYRVHLKKTHTNGLIITVVHK